MRKPTILLLSLFLTVSGIAKTVTMDAARILADNYYNSYNRVVTRAVEVPSVLNIKVLQYTMFSIIKEADLL